MAKKAGEARIEISAVDKFSKTLNNIYKEMDAFGAKIRKVGAISVGVGAAMAAPFAAAAKVFASAGDDLTKMSDRTGASVESLSLLKYAADQSGSSMEGLEKGIKLSQKALADAAKNGGSAKKKFTDLGLSVKGLMSLTPDQQFITIADAISKIQNPALKTGAALEVFGKSGSELMPLMLAGSRGIKELMTQGQRLNQQIGSKDSSAATELGDRWDDVTATIKRTAFAVGASLAPELSKLFKTVAEGIAGFSRLVDQNRNLVAAAAKATLGIIAFGAATYTMGLAVTVAAYPLKVLSVAMTAASGAAVALGAAIKFAQSSLILLDLAVVAATGAVIYYSGVMDKTLAILGKRFDRFKDDALKAFNGIKAALSAGDITKAAEILWVGIRIAFNDGMAAVVETITGTEKSLTGIVINAWYDILKSASDVAASVSSLWVRAATAVASAWASVTGGIVAGFYDVAAATADAVGATGLGQSARNLADTARQDTIEEVQSIAGEAANELVRIERDRSARLAAFNSAAAEATKGLKSFGEEAADLRKQLEEMLRPLPEASAPGNLTDGFLQIAPTGPNKALNVDVEELERKAKFSTRGTFNADAIQALQGGSVDDRIANAAEKTAKNTGRLIESVERARPRFT